LRLVATRSTRARPAAHIRHARARARAFFIGVGKVGKPPSAIKLRSASRSSATPTRPSIWSRGRSSSTIRRATDSRFIRCRSVGARRYAARSGPNREWCSSLWKLLRKGHLTCYYDARYRRKRARACCWPRASHFYASKVPERGNVQASPHLR